MDWHEKLKWKILQGLSDANIPFESLRKFLLRLGFEERVKGSHHIFWKTGVEEILNLQHLGPRAKPYQVRQVRNLLVRHKMGGKSDVEV